jgi:hypothetical protein
MAEGKVSPSLRPSKRSAAAREDNQENSVPRTLPAEPCVFMES